MEFNLFYRGQVKSNAKPKLKHNIRLAFHKQLELLWQLTPLINHIDWKNREDTPLFKTVSKNKYLCLVVKNLDMYVELDINFLVPMNSSFCDIDNKLKTICDALQLPNHEAEKSINQKNKIQPLICLLENDKFIYKINSDVEYILENKFENNNDRIFHNEHEMICIIRVKIKGNRNIGEYSDLII